MKDCPFCGDIDSIIDESKYWYAIYDKYPVSKGHTLLISKRHISSFFDLTSEETRQIHSMIKRVKRKLDDKYFPNGYNIGVNCGRAAGQTVPHCHIHIIPRYDNDVSDPTGGIRGVIPNKQKY